MILFLPRKQIESPLAVTLLTPSVQNVICVTTGSRKATASTDIDLSKSIHNFSVFPIFYLHNIYVDFLCFWHKTYKHHIIVFFLKIWEGFSGTKVSANSLTAEELHLLGANADLSYKKKIFAEEIYTFDKNQFVHLKQWSGAAITITSPGTRFTNSSVRDSLESRIPMTDKLLTRIRYRTSDRDILSLTKENWLVSHSFSLSEDLMAFGCNWGNENQRCTQRFWSLLPEPCQKFRHHFFVQPVL